MRNWINRHGRIFEINVPLFGRSVVVSDPALVRSVCTAGVAELANVRPNLGNWFGPGSVFGLEGRRHLDRRRLLAPPFHGRSLKNYEELIEDETLRECAAWPEDEEFRTLEPMNRITLNVILRTLFGADGADLDAMRRIIPAYMKLGQLLAFLPTPPFPTGRYSPWGRLAALRSEFDRIVSALAMQAAADPRLDERTDVLAVLLRSARDDATSMPPEDLCDELMTLVCAGHETTASALAWTFERLRRHPEVLARLVREVDEGGGTFRRATIAESLRARTVIDVFGRRVSAPNLDLGRWRIPAGRTVLVRIADVHENPEIYSRPECFDPARFTDVKAAAPGWLAFGAGPRRCVGADFAIAEMDVVLRTVLRHFRIHTDAAPDERSHFRGVAHVPKRGGRVVVNPRR